VSFAFEQLPLALQLRDDHTFDNFYGGDNTLLLNQLQGQLNGGERYIYLYGSEGSGCTHLLQAACHQASSQGLTSVYLPLAELADYPPAQLFEGLEQLALVCIDELQAVAGDDLWEEALFHLFNRLERAGVILLVAANSAVRTLPLALADLASRLSWGTLYQLKPLADDQQMQMLQFRAAQRGLDISPEVAQFIVHRCQRRTPALVALLQDLDTASLKEQRRLTIPFVKSVMGW
jgi:DnaA family protein